MRKKINVCKLSLGHETIRELTEKQVRHAIGGAEVTGPPSETTGCKTCG